MNSDFSNSIVEIQEQTQELQQRLTARQIAYMRLLEMPVDMLRNRIEEELMNNVALEVDSSSVGDSNAEPLPINDSGQDDDMETIYFKERQDQDSIDEMEYFESERPEYNNQQDAYEFTTIDDPDVEQFHDTLLQQMSEYTLTDHQHSLLEYLIGSLDDSGLLTKKLYVIVDELEIYRQIHTTVDELKEMLDILQQFDPPGIGGRSLQETLILQINRRIEDKPDNTMWPLLLQVVETYWTQIIDNKWEKISKHMKISESETRALRRLLRTLTPSPGCPLGESMGTGRRSSASINPDFIVEVGEDGTLLVQLNETGIPTLRINPDFESMVNENEVPSTNTRHTAEQRAAANYARIRILNANTFIQVLSNRRQTLLLVMKEVAKAQRDYITTGDESQLHTLTMSDVARAIGTDNTIVSRVAGSKWVETPYGIKPLRWYFRQAGGVTNEKGDGLDQDSIKRLMTDLIEAEDKKHPLSDNALTKMMNDKGYPVARRTIAKYREALGIPVARMRRQF